VQVLIFRAGSAGGPKPRRAGFYLELGAGWVLVTLSQSERVRVDAAPE